MKTIHTLIAGIALAWGGFASTASAATIAWWRFDNSDPNLLINSGAGGALYDATKPPSASHSTTVSGPYINDGNGVFYANESSYVNGGGLNTVGASLGAGAATALSGIVAQSFSLEAIVYLNASPSAFAGILGNGGGSGGSFFFGTQNTGAFRFYGTSVINSSNFQMVGSVLEAKRWYSLAMVATWDAGANATSVQLYIDGVASGSAHSYAGGLKIDSAALFTIGGPNAFNGYIDELRISDTALTPSQFLHAESIPEPATAFLALAAGGAVWSVRKRSRKVSRS